MKTVLVPLCGKSLDLIHLHSLGHNVIGVEWIEQACLEFFSENKIEYSVAPLEGVEGSVYTSTDGRLRIYQCDFLHLTESLLGGKVDAVWDIQSLVSINPRDRKQYVRTVRWVSATSGGQHLMCYCLCRSILSDEFKYLLVTIEYEPFAHLGRSVDSPTMRSNLGQTRIIAFELNLNI